MEHTDKYASRVDPAGLYRLKNIFPRKRRPPLIDVSASTWWDGENGVPPAFATAQ